MRGVAPILSNPWRRGRILLGLRVGLLLGCLPLLVLAADLALHPGTRSHPQPSSLERVPNGALLVALGLSTRPATRPTGDRVRVERLVYDGQAAYLLYRAAANPDWGQPWRPVLPGPPYLYDQRGRRYAPTDSTESSGWPDDEGLARYPQLAPDARTVTLNLAGQGAVRLAIPAPLPIWRVARPLLRRTVHGITLTLTRLANSAAGTYVTYTLDRPGRVSMFFYQDRLITRGGAELSDESTMEHMDCLPIGARMHCTVMRAFAPQPAGTRLLLSLRSVTLLTGGHRTCRVFGPWRVPLTLP